MDIGHTDTQRLVRDRRWYSQIAVCTRILDKQMDDTTSFVLF